MSDPPARPHSKAFESLVQDPEDLVGLIAYALYKQNIREAIVEGRVVHPSDNRFPTPTETRAYRGAAEQRLAEFAGSAIEQARPELEASGFTEGLAAAKAELLQRINERTSVRSAIGTNLVAWLISIGITLLVVWNGVPDWLSRIIGHH